MKVLRDFNELNSSLINLKEDQWIQSGQARPVIMKSQKRVVRLH